MASRIHRAGAGLSFLFLWAGALHAQCPDGTPPPCGSRSVARATPAAIPTASERSRRFLVLPFRNVTRQPDQDWLVEGATTMLVDALGRWQGISVVPDERLYPALKRAGIEAGAVMDPPRVRRVSEETGGWTAVTGEVIATGGRLRVTARAWDVPTNRELVRAASEVPLAGDVRVAFDSVSLRLLRSVGLDSVTPDLVGATTQNVDAYRAYLRGLAHMRRAEVKGAVAAFQEAIQADSGFALAWARLAGVQLATEPASLFTPGSKGAQYSARAVSLSSKLPPRFRQLVTAADASFRAQFTEVRRTLDALVAADSNDVEALEQMVGLELFDPLLIPAPGGKRPRGSLNRAAQLAKQVVTLDPGRSAMYGMLATIYAQAGIPGGNPTIGVEGEVSSLMDLMQAVQRPQRVRAFYPILRADTIALVPAESLSFIPKDSVNAARRTARDAARAWADRWIAVSQGESAPFQLASELHSIDGDYRAALRAVAQAESIGVQNPAWSAPARRMFFQAKAGQYVEALRVADSLTAAGFFANPNNMMFNGDAASWAFGLHLLAGKLQGAGALLESNTVLMRMLAQGSRTPGLSAFRTLLGNSDPDDEPRIPRAFRARQLDTALARVREFAASEKIGPWVPLLLPTLAEAAGEEKQRSAALLRAAQTLAEAGRDTLAFQLASNAVVSDSSLGAAASAFDWYRRGAAALGAARTATIARFTPASALIGADRAVFEWKVNDSTPFMWNRPETPPGRVEYRWDVVLGGEGRYYRMMASAGPKAAGTQPATGPLAEVLPPTGLRSLFTGSFGAGGIESDTTAVVGATVTTEFAPGVMRMVVTDKAVLSWLATARPGEARFKFFPCAEPPDAPKVCLDEKVAIRYQ